MGTWRTWARIATATIVTAAATIALSGSPVQAEQPPPTLALLVDGDTIRDSSVVATGTELTAVASGLLTQGTGSRELRIDLDPLTVYEPGGVTAPEGWTVEWSTDGGTSWVGSEPAVPADVTNVRATADVVAGVSSQGSQRYTQTFTAPVPASTFSANTGGDGWDTFFYDDYVLNIFHHDSSAVRLSCNLRSTGERCPDFDPNDDAKSRFAGYRAGDRSGGWVSGNTGIAYAFTAEISSNTPGALCIDLNTAPPQDCGFTALSGATNVTSYSPLSNAEGVGGRLFGSESVNHQLLCLDATTEAACAGSPIQLAGNGNTSMYHVYPLGSKVFASTDTTLYCFEAATLAACGGAWPVTYASLSWTPTEMSPVAHMDANGTIDGVCMWNGCLDLVGADRTTGGDWVNPHSVTDWADNASNNSWSGRYGRFEASAGRAFLQDVLSSDDVYCFDYATEAACAGFGDTPSSTTSMYALRADPNNPNCIWYNSDPGNIGLFDAISGEQSCTANPVITLQPSAFAPRFVCSTSGGIDRWISVTMNEVNGTDPVTTQALTMRTGDGDPVPGWVDVPLTVSSPLDLSGLSVASTGARPSFNIGFQITSGEVTSAEFTVVYQGRGPELCVDTTVQAAGCPQIIGLGASITEKIGNAAPVTRAAAPRSIVAGGDANQCPEDLILATPPAPVGGPTPIRNGPGDCIIRFAAPADDGGSPIRWYEYSIDGGPWIVAQVEVEADGMLSFPIDCTDGETNEVRIRPVNLLGPGDPVVISLAPQATPGPTTSPSTTTTPATQPPLSPTLPPTGNATDGIAPIGFVFVGLGALGLFAARRRPAG